MIVGVGIDVVEIDRFGATLERTPGMRERLFTATELTRARCASLAARFAAKEALAKALGAPAGLHWIDAEVQTDETGRPLARALGLGGSPGGRDRRQRRCTCRCRTTPGSPARSSYSRTDFEP